MHNKKLIVGHNGIITITHNNFQGIATIIILLLSVRGPLFIMLVTIIIMIVVINTVWWVFFMGANFLTCNAPEFSYMNYNIYIANN